MKGVFSKIKLLCFSEGVNVVLKVIVAVVTPVELLFLLVDSSLLADLKIDVYV